ncbi:MAG TPA: type II toxin-antitoxin system RelE/ParE family toxin, partial [Pirellulales bacterium]
SAAWWAGERSAEQAGRWYQGIRNAIAGLRESPTRYVIAPERPRFSYEIRELHFGLSARATHRVLFTIVGQTVVVLTVRHAAQREIVPGDLA